MNIIKNKFYSTLKKVATQAQLENPSKYNQSFIKCKKNLLQFVDVAIIHGQALSSKRGRKKNIDRILAPGKAILFPSESGQSTSSRSNESLPAFSSTFPQLEVPEDPRMADQIELLNSGSIYCPSSYSREPLLLSSLNLFSSINGACQYQLCLNEVAHSPGIRITLPLPETFNHPRQDLIKDCC